MKLANIRCGLTKALVLLAVLPLFSFTCEESPTPEEISKARKIDIFYKTYKNDDAFLRLSLATLDRFAVGFRKVVIVTDSDHDLKASDFNLKNIKIEIFKEVIPSGWGSLERYNHQQYVKMNFKKWTDANAILSLDSNVILYNTITPDIYYSNKSKPIWLFESYEEVFKGIDQGMVDALGMRRSAVGYFLQRKPEEVQSEFMRFPGFLITRKLADKVEGHIKKTFNKSVYEFMTEPSIIDSHKHTEFNYLGAFAYYLDPEKEYDFIDIKKSIISYSKTNSQIPEAIQRKFPIDGRPYPLIQYHSYTKDPRELTESFEPLFAEYQLWDYLHVPKDKYLVLSFGARTGMANRIKSTVSALVSAELTGRKVCLAWPINDDMVAGFDDLFINDIPLLYNFAPLTKKRLIFRFPYEQTNQYEPRIASSTSDVVLMDSYKTFRDRDIKFKDFFALYLKHLKSLKPVKDISEDVNRFAARNFNGKDVVGIHFRSWSAGVGDESWNLKSENISEFFKEMDKELKQNPEVFFFVTADDKKLKDKFVEQYGDKIILSGIPVIARNTVESQKYGLFEWLLLGKTRFIIGTTLSTFSDEAALLTIEQRKINIGTSQFSSDHNPVICFDKTGQVKECIN